MQSNCVWVYHFGTFWRGLVRNCTSQVSPPSLSGGGDVINDFLNNSPVFQPNMEWTSISGDCSPRARRRRAGRGRGAPGRGGEEEPPAQAAAEPEKEVGEKKAGAGGGRGEERGASGRRKVNSSRVDWTLTFQKSTTSGQKARMNENLITDSVPSVPSLGRPQFQNAYPLPFKLVRTICWLLDADANITALIDYNKYYRSTGNALFPWTCKISPVFETLKRTTTVSPTPPPIFLNKQFTEKLQIPLPFGKATESTLPHHARNPPPRLSNMSTLLTLFHSNTVSHKLKCRDSESKSFGNPHNAPNYTSSPY